MPVTEAFLTAGHKAHMDKYEAALERHAIILLLHPGWTVLEVAAALGVHPATVSDQRKEMRRRGWL